MLVGVVYYYEIALQEPTPKKEYNVTIEFARRISITANIIVEWQCGDKRDVRYFLAGRQISQQEAVRIMTQARQA